MKTVLSLLSLLLQRICKGQFSESSPEFDQANTQEVDALNDLLGSRKDTLPIFNPQKALIPNDLYVNDFPSPASYKIEMIMDPCRYLQYNCCLNVFGTAEYPSLIIANLESERYVRYQVLGNENEVQVNYQQVYEDGNSVPDSSNRYASDDSIFDLSCEEEKVPYTYCAGKHHAYVKSKLRPACSDNNSTLKSLASCTYPNGTTSTKCTQIGYNQNAFIAQCNPKFTNPPCGTFIEIHMPGGTLYQSETTVISEVKLDTFNVSGVYTTVISLTWQNDPQRVLCAYQETYLRVGSTVYILPTAPACCCPPLYQASTKKGVFFCPYGTTGSGPFATVPETLTDIISVDTNRAVYPYCLTTYKFLNDSVMYADYDAFENRNFVRYAANVNITYNVSSSSSSYVSRDLQGSVYTETCPYFTQCAASFSSSTTAADSADTSSTTATDTSSTSGGCAGQDSSFTFAGHVGVVTAIVDSLESPAVWVSFNGGRTAYFFGQEHVQLEYKQKSMYELWWVVRSRSDRRLQRRKGFNVTSPACTFDMTNNRFFPFAILDGISGQPLNSSFNVYA